MAARVAMASVRERLADGHWTASSLELRALDVSLPLAQRAAFELHGPDLDAPRAALLERPVALLDALWPTISAIEALPPNSQTRVRSELQDCVFNLALAEYAAARRDQLARARGRPVDAPSPLDPRAIDLPASESMPVAGHPWHPMCKTRLGLTLRENLRHAPELLGDGACAAVDVDARHVAAHGEYAALAARLFPPAPRGLVRVAVHPAQLRALPSLLPCSWGQVIQRAALPPRPARALLSLRTVALEPPGEGSLHVKLALNVHTTSCARTVSPMSQANGPQLSALLERVQSVDPLTRGSVRVQADLGGAGLRPDVHGDRARQLGVLLREPPDALARAIAAPDEPAIWVCAALGERAPGHDAPLIAALADGYPGAPAARAEAMIGDYIERLVPPLLRLLVAHGLALEAHLQNCLVVSSAGRVRGFIIRDLGGVRVHRPRLRAAGHAIAFAPGSFIATDSLDEVQRKLSHVLLHAHLTAVFAWAERALGLDPRVSWARARAVIARALATWSREPRLREACARDREFLLAPRCLAKALFRMRLIDRSSEYRYTEVDNALA